MEFPNDPCDSASWLNFAASHNKHLPDMCAYLYQHLIRERELGSKWHKLAMAFAYKCVDDQPTGPDNDRRCLFKCVHCKYSVLTDAGNTGQFLACGHPMHTFCMTSFCAKGTVAPTCPECGVRYIPPDANPRVQLHYTQVMTAARLLEAPQRAEELAAIRKDYADHKFVLNTETPELDRLILTEGSALDSVIQAAVDVCGREKQRLMHLANETCRQLIPSVTLKQYPFPPAPKTRMQRPSTSPAKVKMEATSVPSVVSMPPDLEPDVLLPLGSVLPMHTKVDDKLCFISKFNGKCKKCKRPQTKGRSIVVVEGDKQYVCSICALEKTSALIYEIALGGQDIEDDVGNDVNDFGIHC